MAQSESAPARPGLRERWLVSPADGEPVTLRQGLFIIAGVLFADLLLYQFNGGVGTGLFFLVITLGLVALRPERVRTREVYLLVAYLALLACRQAWDLTFGGSALAWLLLGTLAVFCATGLRRLAEGTVAGVFSYAMGWSMALLHLGANAARLLGLWGLVRDRKWRACALILIPLLAAAFTAVVFGLIFVAANPVLGHYWDIVFARFAEIIDLVLELVPGFGHLFFWGLMLWLMAGLVTPLLPRAVANFINTQREEQRSPQGEHLLVRVTALAVLGAACLTFLAYDLFDARYLWLHGALPAGITYSQYAHEGAGWLTFALLLSTVVIGLATSPLLVPDRREGVTRTLAYGWVALDAMMALGVLRRLQLYIAYNGLTPARLLGIAGTLLVIAGLVIMAVKLRQRRNFVWLARRYVAALLIALVITALFPDDYACARFNVWQAMRGNDRPLVWLSEHWQSTGSEAYPALLPLLRHREPVVANGVRAYLAYRLEELNREQHPLATELADDYAAARLRAAGIVPAPVAYGWLGNDPAWSAFRSHVQPWRNGSRDSWHD